MTVKFLWNLITILQKISIKISIRKIEELLIFQGFDQTFFQELDDSRILVNFFKDFDRDPWRQLYCLTIQMTIQFFKNYMTVKFFQYLMKSVQKILKYIWIMKLYQNGILVKFPRIWSEFFLRIRWPRKCFGILHRFQSELWWPLLLSNNLDDHRILMKLVLDFIKILQELDDHGNNMTIFNDFDQNSGCQPHYQTIQMAIEFFKK